MATTDEVDPTPPLHVPERAVPVPVSVSPAARSALAAGTASPQYDYPPAAQADAWRATIAATDRHLLSLLEERSDGTESDVQSVAVGDVEVIVITPGGSTSGHRRVYLDIHGGALVFGGGACCRAMGIRSAAIVQAPTWSVDYRMPPDFPYPTPLDDCVSAYRALLGEYRPEEIIVGGGSAGGNLAAATILKARDEGLPIPAAAVLMSPEVDLTESGDTFHTNLGVDTVLTGSLRSANELYAGGHDLHDPYLSPLFGDFTKGFPPTFLQAGTRDLFLSNTVRMHRALRSAGVEAELHVFEAMPHGGFGTTPEDADLEHEIRRFCDAHWPKRQS